MKNIIKANLSNFFENKKILVTGGSGFIGSSLILRLLIKSNSTIFNLDKRSYPSDLIYKEDILFEKIKNYKLLKINLENAEEISNAVNYIKPDLIFHLAAESHVDRSIENPLNFINSNIVGTFNLLEGVKNYYVKLENNKKNTFKFHHISTDEVFGSIEGNDKFNENSNYDPRSPYSASKAASDHLVISWFHTYGIPTLITNCSNNYGPRQFPEKLIPLIIQKAIFKKQIPIYGNGKNIRDWLFVEDHIDALLTVAEFGKSGDKYCIGGSNEKNNLEVCSIICKLIKNLKKDNFDYESLIEFVEDRPGHDKRYAIDHSFISKKLGWRPKTNFDEGLRITIEWYLNNQNWCENITNNLNYQGQRIGLINKET